MSAQRPSDSAVETTHLVLPPDTNHHGTAFGGMIMQWMDVAGGISAARHCRMPVVTVAVDDLVFARPIREGDVVIIKASVNYTGRTSMEVGVRVEREEMKSRQREHCLTGYFTFVAIGKDGRPLPVPEIQPGDEVEKRRWEAARRRREERLQRAKSRA
jgi:acyl-CoA hydrolase